MKQIRRGQQRIFVYTVAEAARILGKHEDTIRRWGDAGKIVQYKTAGHMAQRLYPQEQIDQLKAQADRYAELMAQWDAETEGNEITDGSGGQGWKQ